MENPWLWKGQPVTDADIKGMAGFVYLITDPSGKKYIGRKYLTFRRKKKGSKRRVSIESDWKDYYSSSVELQELVELQGKENFKREILQFGRTKGEVNFLEVEEQFKRDVLRDPNYWNDQISGKYFKKNVINYARASLNLDNKD